MENLVVVVITGPGKWAYFTRHHAYFLDISIVDHRNHVIVLPYSIRSFYLHHISKRED